MEVGESPSLEVFQNRVDVTLWGWVGVKPGLLGMFSNLNDSSLAVLAVGLWDSTWKGP